MKKKAIVLAVAVSGLGCGVNLGDWPTYRGDAARSGYTPNALAPKLALQWVYRSEARPRPAWPRSKRLRDDRAYHVVVAGGTVYFGSSADCHIHALDAATGREAWSFATAGPVRFAPTVWRDPSPETDSPRRLLAVSDDGLLYCLDAATGKLLWKRRGGPGDGMLLGNGRMVSRWCARGAPVVVGPSTGSGQAAVYFGAGIWPSEGIFLYALDARTGKTIWRNAEGGGIHMPQPHGGAWAKSGFAAQGYLLAAGEQLFVPTGRAVPAALNRADGKLQYFHLQAYGKLGGSSAAVLGPYLINGDAVFDPRGGRAVLRGIPAAAAAGPPGWIVYYARGEVRAVDAADAVVIREVPHRGGKLRRPMPNVKWSAKADAGGASLIVAGTTVVSGGAGKVATVDMEAKKQVWSAAVDGQALGLAAAGGRLFVSTDRGAIYCFGPAGDAAPATETGPPREADPYGDSAAFAAAAKAILAKTGVTEGYCVDLGCGDGALAYELAKRSKLTIYAVDADAANVAAARRKLRSAGLYGVRVTVHRARGARTPYPDYFADLAVSARSVRGGAGSAASGEMLRLLRPGGGVACVGKLGAMKQTVRPALAGAGNWTHQYADPGNTICGSDRLVRGPLGLLWFDCPDIRLPNRHGRGHAPLSDGARLFVEGVAGLRALDIYNGRMLWEYPLPNVLKPFHQEHIMGTAGTGSNFCLGPGQIFLHTGGKCLVIDAATGKKLTEHAAPKLPDGKPGRWGYVAFAGGTLFGTLVNEEHLVPYRFGRSDMRGMFTESRVLFAMDPKTGRVRWRYAAKKSIRHNAIAVGAGRVYLIDRELAAETPGRRRLVKPQPPGVLLALDAATGREVWRNEKDIYGTMLAVSDAHDALLMAYQATRFRLNSEVGGRMAALRASTGERLWDIQASYASRPLINGRTLYAQPHAWDLLTGKQRTVGPADQAQPWSFGRSYGCGILSAAPNLLLFRSATLGYRDLGADRPTANYGGIRPGCWINVVPAGGLVLMPDATTLCTCSYLNTATVALKPTGVWPPKIQPEGGGFRGPTQVEITAVPKGAVARYTLDSRDPGPTSARYSGPITVAKSGTLRARIFRSGRPISDAVSAEFLVDKHLLPTGRADWEIWDAPGAKGAPSRWVPAGHVIEQHSNIFTGSSGPAKPDQPRYGTLLIFRGPALGGDGELSLQMRSEDDDVFGVAFRLKDPQHHYLWAMDRQRGMHVLACRNGDAYTLLASNRKGYRQGKWHAVRVVLRGPRITVFVDGAKDLEATDKTFAGGTVALHVWGNVGSSFRTLRWVPAPDAEHKP